MKKILLTTAVLTLFAGASHAATDAKSYQVTGPVTEVNDNTITVMKGSEKWQIAKGTAAVPADVKVGSKVTVQYTMTATQITDKAAKTK